MDITTGPGGGADEPVLWVGAGGDPPVVVEIRLDAGAGQTRLIEALADPQRSEPVTVFVDTTTSVLWTAP
jgi:hypothetical protein